MKIFVKIATAVCVVLVLAGCKGGKNNTSGTVAHPKGENVADQGVNTVKSTEDIYLSLPLLDLPLESDVVFLNKFQAYDTPGESDLRRLTGSGDMTPPNNRSSKAVRLPKNNGMGFLLAGYLENGDWTIDLYSLSEDLDVKDRIRVYSTEKVDESTGLIRQTFGISGDYKLVVAKHLAGTLIERLTYTPSDQGIFEELRDGKTVTVAFDSYDGLNYIVETFVWDCNTSGGLVKKDLQVTNYRIAENGGLVKVD